MSQLNVGNLDRAARIAAGVALLALTIAGTIGPWGWVGIVPIVSGLAAFCPLYAMLGVATTSR